MQELTPNAQQYLLSHNVIFSMKHAVVLMTGTCCQCRFKDMSADHGSVAKELERANEEFKEFERKDIKYREDLKHIKAKLKKLQDKLTKDSAKMQVGLLLPQSKVLLMLLLVKPPLVPPAAYT